MATRVSQHGPCLEKRGQSQKQGADTGARVSHSGRGVLDFVARQPTWSVVLPDTANVGSDTSFSIFCCILARLIPDGILEFCYIKYAIRNYLGDF